MQRTSYDSRLPVLGSLCFLVLGLGICSPAAAQEPGPVRIGSKSFTESVILGEMLGGLVSHAGHTVEFQSELGGTQILWQALLRGEIDAYV